jgi:hypothetical protein
MTPMPETDKGGTAGVSNSGMEPNSIFLGSEVLKIKRNITIPHANTNL